MEGIIIGLLWKIEDYVDVGFGFYARVGLENGGGEGRKEAA